MFLAIIFIVLGVVLLLNAFGIILGANFWGLFWAIVFLAIGIRLLTRRGKCPMCGWGMWHEKIHGKIHKKMHGHCDCECDHTGHDEPDNE